jgi:hypothetical protein
VAESVFVLVLEDRHIDVEVTPYREREAAIAAARHILDEQDGTEERLTSAMRADDWIFYGTYSSEEDCVRVVERELH